jgi:hypothetical protein
MAERRLLKALQWARQNQLGGHLCDAKPGCITLHRNGMKKDSELLDLFESAHKEWQPLSEGGHLGLRDFEEGIELRVPGCTERGVVQKVLSDEHWTTSCIAYLGSDAADERAFQPD